MRKIAGVFFLVSALLLSPRPAAAEPMRWTAGLRTGDIVIDGSLDEAAWCEAVVGGSFTVHNTYVLAEKDTEAIFLWDREGLYAGIRAWETDLVPGSRGSTVRDAGVFTNDRIELFLKKGETYRHYAVNSLGTQYDALGKDASADWQWQAACGTAGGNRREFEIFIPWEAAGFTGEAGDVFQFNIARFAKSNDELSVWQPWFGGFHDAPQLFPEMVLGESFAANLKVDVNSLSRSPASFAFADNENIGVDGCKLEVLVSDGSVLDLGYDGMDRKTEIPANLWIGRHFLQFSVYRDGEVVYIQRLPWEVKASETDPEAVADFDAVLVQPWFETEAEGVLEYTNDGCFESAAWRIVDAGGAVIDSGEAALDYAGRIFFPVPEANGEYKLVLDVADMNMQIDFTRADAVGEPRQWLAVGEDGAWLKDGVERVFPLIYYALGYEDMIFARDMGADMVISGSDWWHSVDGPAPGIVERNLECLDRAEALGVPVAMMMCNVFRGGKKDFASLRYAVARMKNHPALAAWYIADEPALYHIDPAVLEKAAEIIREIDPIHPVAGCEVKTGKFRDYRECFDLFGVDPYPGFPGGDLGMVDEFITAMQRDVDPDKFQFVILQGFGKPFSARHPTRDETLNMVLQVLASGADGICWWTVEFIREEPEAYKEMAGIVKELGGRLAAGDIETLRRGGILIGMSPDLFIAVNTGAAPAQTELPFPPDADVRWQAGEVSLNGTTLKLGPYAGAVWLPETEEQTVPGGCRGRF